MGLILHRYYGVMWHRSLYYQWCQLVPIKSGNSAIILFLFQIAVNRELDWPWTSRTRQSVTVKKGFKGSTSLVDRVADVTQYTVIRNFSARVKTIVYSQPDGAKYSCSSLYNARWDCVSAAEDDESPLLSCLRCLISHSGVKRHFIEVVCVTPAVVASPSAKTKDPHRALACQTKAFHRLIGRGSRNYWSGPGGAA